MKAATDPLSIGIKALSDPTRRRILALVSKKPMTHIELLAKVDVAQPTMSHHVKILRRAKLVTEERTGISIHVSMKKEAVENLVAKLKKDVR